jgi:hypothetical protein
MQRALITIGLAFAAACGDGGGEVVCVTPLCALPIAIRLTVTGGNAAPVNGLLFKIIGPGAGFTCDPIGASICAVLGYEGSYQLDISAPGFQSVQKTVQVGGTGPQRCGCRVVNTENVVVALVASSSPGSGRGVGT